MNQYEEFIKNKSKFIHKHGFEPTIPFHESMFDFQLAITKWAIRKGKAAVWAGCGLGKTRMQLEWANAVQHHTGKPVLIFAPLAVSTQTQAEGQDIGIDISILGDGIIRITNYEKLSHVNPAEFAGIVLDECFPGETPIECFSLDNSLALRYIKDVKVGDKILNAQGEDHVKEIYKRKINRAVQVSIGGRKITCSENHPFFTVHGWRSAQDLQPGDYILATRTAMRMVRGDIQTEVFGQQVCQVLRDILLSEMEDVTPETQGQCPHQGNTCEDWSESICLEKVRRSESHGGNGKNQESKSDATPRDAGQGVCCIAEDEAQTFRAWGQWNGDDIAAANYEGCIVRELDCGIHYITGKTKTRFSNSLQSRLRESRRKDSDRSRRELPLFKEKTRPEERQNAGIFRVDSVEVLEPGHPELERHRDESGIVYFYDIKAERHPSFSVNGLLVHNSSILKNFAGKFKNQIVESFAKTPYKLCCSATPSPNDYTEIGNHAEFLNVCSRSEMLATYFIHDSGATQKWRLKGHAEKPFFKWLASWAVMLNKPSDLGFSNEGFDLPPINITECRVESTPGNGMLFVEPAMGLTDRRNARRESIYERCKLAASLSFGSNDPWIYWCDLNDESKTLSELVTNSVEVKGSDKNEVKESRMIGFSRGDHQKIITKPKIAQFGMNWQHCNNVVFVGLSDSFEAYYQAVRRCWRFGQKKPVNVYIVISDREGSVVENIKQKELKMTHMTEQMVEYMKIETVKELGNMQIKQPSVYEPKTAIKLPAFLRRQAA